MASVPTTSQKGAKNNWIFLGIGRVANNLLKYSILLLKVTILEKGIVSLISWRSSVKSSSVPVGGNYRVSVET